MSNRTLKKIVKSVLILFATIIIFFVLLILLRDLYTKEYYSSDGFSGESIMVYFGLLYEYDLNSDIGKIDKQFGYITKSDDLYKFNVFISDSNTFHRFPRNYYKVFWNDREYLIDEDWMLFFCNLYNSGELVKEFNNPVAQYFLVDNNSKGQKPFGKPVVPKKFFEKILDRTIETEIIDKFPNSFSLKINKGSIHKLFVGCMLYENKPNGLNFEIISIEDSAAIVQVFWVAKLGLEERNENKEALSKLIEDFNSIKKYDTLSTKYKYYKSFY